MLHILGNSRLNIEIALIKMTREVDKGNFNFSKLTDQVKTVVPVDLSAILNLEIAESTLAMGATGSITINNNFNILEQLAVTTNSPYDLYIAIDIVDEELKDVKISKADKTIKFTGLITNSAGASANAIDNIITFTFEEAMVAAMRTTNLSTHKVGTGLTTDQKRDLRESADGLLLNSIEGVTPLHVTEQFYDDCFKLKDSSEKNINTPGATPNVKHALAHLHFNKNTKDPKASDYIYQTRKSVYDVVQALMDRTLAASNTGANTIGRVPYYRFVNVVKGNNVVRKLKFDTYMTERHIDFVAQLTKNPLQRNKLDTDYSDVWLEKFSFDPIGLNAVIDPNISTHNHIEQYNITRADVQHLRETCWGNYHSFQEFIGQGNSQTKRFDQIVQDFFNEDIALDVKVNAPIIDSRSLRKFSVKPSYILEQKKDDNYGRRVNENVIGNRVRKSFLTVNETITFTIKGQIYRKPNMFIWIERGVEEEDYQKLWYVNHVTHIIANGEHTTKIIASKLFGETTGEGIEANRIAEEKIARTSTEKKPTIAGPVTELNPNPQFNLSEVAPILNVQQPTIQDQLTPGSQDPVPSGEDIINAFDSGNRLAVQPAGAPSYWSTLDLTNGAQGLIDSSTGNFEVRDGSIVNANNFNNGSPFNLEPNGVSPSKWKDLSPPNRPPTTLETLNQQVADVGNFFDRAIDSEGAGNTLLPRIDNDTPDVSDNWMLNAIDQFSDDTFSVDNRPKEESE